MTLLKAKYGWNVLYPESVPDGKIFECILKNRGIDDVDRFFSMGRESLFNPLLFADMEKAVARIRLGIANHESMMIYGDYDCDGISSISVLYRALKRLDAKVLYDLPDRFSDGYGLSLRAVDDIIRAGVGLVITVDNGITCFEEIAKLNAAGIDTIITDHHEIIGEPPAAYAILHAALSPDYPFKDLAGVGIAYKLASALTQDSLEDLMDLVMIGTVADLVTLQSENQAFVNLGIARLKKTTNLGLKKLLQYSHLDQINVTAIAFKIGPKINSSGRMGKAKEAVQLLISESEEEVNRLILAIEANHTARKDLTDEAYKQCEKMVDTTHHVLVLASADFHEGVIGICAQKIAEKYQKSTCVICLGEDRLGKGSMRSYGDEDILSLLSQSSDLLERFGGHAQAAGLALQMDNIPQFQARLDQLSAAQNHPILSVDVKVELSEVSLETIKKLERYSFFTAKYLFTGLQILAKSIMTGKHTKLVVSDGTTTVEAIVFNNLEYFYRLEPGDIVDLVGGLSVNTWRNAETLQILIRDLACTHFQVLDLRNEARYTEALSVLRLCEQALILDDAIAIEDFDLPTLFHSVLPTTVVIGASPRAQVAARLFHKEGIGSIYRLIQKAGTLTFEHLATLAKTPGWAIRPIVAIFEEIQLVDRSGENIRLVASPEKRNLSDSATFHQLMAVRQQLEFLANESLQTIKTYFNNLLEASQ